MHHQTDDEKSTPELTTQTKGYKYSPSNCGQQTSESNITLELATQKPEKRKVKTVNVI